MATTFTQSSNESIWNIHTLDDDPTKAIDYLNNKENFRSFSEGLTELMCKYTYTGSIYDNEEKTNFLYDKLLSIGVNITKSTIKDWFSDKRRPSFFSNSRTIMFQICFALSVSIDDIRWFFSHVFFDRTFNCHTIKEAVYYYCFLNHFSYAHGNKLLDVINTFPETELSKNATITSSNILSTNNQIINNKITNNINIANTDIINTSNSDIIFTAKIQDKLNQFSNDEELLEFFRYHKTIFNTWNQTAKKYIYEFLSEIHKKEDDKDCFDSFKKGKYISKKDMKKCSLIIQELLQYHGYLIKDIAYKNITSIDFMLDCIFNTTTRFNKRNPKDITRKKVNLPKVVSTNFPDKKTFSDILLNIDTSTSYDAIRKCLVLLKFYAFWCHAKLNSNFLDLDAEDTLFDIYLAETNTLLISCGYEELFSGNPYDWIFLCCATSDEPLEYFREMIGNISLINEKILLN